jgi:eukaryotic-like serine/threonine-protein kinase
MKIIKIIILTGIALIVSCSPKNNSISPIFKNEIMYKSSTSDINSVVRYNLSTVINSETVNFSTFIISDKKFQNNAINDTELNSSIEKLLHESNLVITIQLSDQELSSKEIYVDTKLNPHIFKFYSKDNSNSQFENIQSESRITGTLTINLSGEILDISFKGRVGGALLVFTNKSSTQKISFFDNAETLYYGVSNGEIICLNANNGNTIWRNQTNGIIGSTPSINKNNLFIGSDNKIFYCLERNSGAILWRNSADFSFYQNSSISDDESVFIGNGNKKFYAYDINSGKTKWEFLSNGRIYGSANLSNNIVFFGSSGGGFYALNSQNGNLLWNFKSNGSNGIPIVSGDLVLFAGSPIENINEDNIYCFEKKSGNLIWKKRVVLGSDFSAGFNEDSFFVSSWDGYIYSINKRTGNINWSFKNNSTLNSNSTYGINTVYFGRKAINSDNGILRWENSEEFDSDSPTFHNCKLFGSSDDSKIIYALDAFTGRKIWETKAEGNINTSPCLVTKNGKVFRGFGNLKP